MVDDVQTSRWKAELRYFKLGYQLPTRTLIRKIDLDSRV